MPSDDEFDAIPDEFEGINFDTIPDLSATTTTQAASATSRSIINNPNRSHTSQSRSLTPLQTTNSANPSSSSDYSGAEDDIDESVLVELDAIEDRLVQYQRHPEIIIPTGAVETISSVEPPSLLQMISMVSERIERYEADHPSATSEPARLSRFFEPPAESSQSGLSHSGEPLNPTSPKKPIHQKIVGSDVSPRTSRKRERTTSSPVKPNSGTTAEKSKAVAGDRRAVRVILENFEHEMTCPICCDIFVAAHLGNPCGHSFCGECGWEWISKHKRSPTCAVCRAKLSVTAPMIPNFTLDSTVTRHLEARAASGEKEWQPNGTRIVEWNAKKEKWKKYCVMRAAEAKAKTKARIPPSSRIRSRVVETYMDDEGNDRGFIVLDDDEDDEDYEDESDDDSYVEEIPPVVLTVDARDLGASWRS